MPFDSSQRWVKVSLALTRGRHVAGPAKPLDEVGAHRQVRIDQAAPAASPAVRLGGAAILLSARFANRLILAMRQAGP